MRFIVCFPNFIKMLGFPFRTKQSESQGDKATAYDIEKDKIGSLIKWKDDLSGNTTLTWTQESDLKNHSLTRVAKDSVVPLTSISILCSYFFKNNK